MYKHLLLKNILIYVIFFFFQAEDGIRDGRVTGVQTCALPIFRAAIGPSRPIVFRFSQWKQQDFRARLANTPQELEEILGPVAEAGVDVFDASVRYFNRAEFEGSSL